MQDKDKKNQMDELLKGLEVAHINQLLDALGNKKLSDILKLLKTFNLKSDDFMKKSGLIANLTMELGEDSNGIEETLRAYKNTKITPVLEDNNNNLPPSNGHVLPVITPMISPVAVVQQPQPEKITERPPYPADWQEFEKSSGLINKKDILAQLDSLRILQLSSKRPFSWFFRYIFDSALLNVAEQQLFGKKFPVSNDWLKFERRVLNRKKLSNAKEQADLEQLDPNEKLTPEDQIEMMDQYILESENANLPFIFSLRKILNSKTILTAPQEVDLAQTFQKEYKWITFEKDLFSKEQQQIVDGYVCKLYTGKLTYPKFLDVMYRKKLLSDGQKGFLTKTFKDDRQVDYHDISTNNMIPTNNIIANNKIATRYKAQATSENKKTKRKKTEQQTAAPISRKRKKAVNENNNHKKDSNKKAKTKIVSDKDEQDIQTQAQEIQTPPQEIQNPVSSTQSNSDALMMAKSMTSLFQSTASKEMTPSTDKDLDIMNSLYFFAQQVVDEAAKEVPLAEEQVKEKQAKPQNSSVNDLLIRNIIDEINQVEKNIHQHQKMKEEYKLKSSSLKS